MNNKCLCGCGQLVKNPANKYVRFHDRIGKWRDEENKIHYCQCGCGEQIKWLKKYSYRGVPKFIFNHHLRISRDILYGSKERHSEIKKKISETSKGKPKPEGFGANISKIQQGVSFEERFGVEKAKEIKIKLNKLRIEDLKQKIILYRDSQLNEYDRQNIEKFRYKFCGKLGLNEKRILDYIQNKININIERFHFIECKSEEKSCLYFPDGYLRNLDILLEVDESDHYKPSRIKKDKIREYYIKKNCTSKIIRLDEQEMLEHMKNNTLPECLANLYKSV